MRSREAEALDQTVRSSSSGLTPSRPHSTSSDRWVGASIDHFVVERSLGRGGMGAVYAARDLSLDRPVALKVIPDELAGNATLEERFIREARAQAKLNSPHVVHIYYIGHLPITSGEPGARGSLFFAMELVDGEPLEATLARHGLLAPEEARTAMLQVALGLRDALRAGIIHRDIKPSNLLRDKEGWVKIADFGIAKPVDGGNDKDKSITLDGIILGTPLYMAPEQARGETVDHRADMYSLGCTFHHLLVGEPPFDAPTPIAVISKHLMQPPPKLRTLVKDVPPKLAAIIERMMCKKAEERHATYDELIAELEAAAPEAVSYVGFWARGVTGALDLVLAGALIAVLGWPGLVIHQIYVVIGTGLFGQTLAKWAMKAEVQRTDGRRLGLPRALARSIAALWMPILVGTLTLVTRGKDHLRAGIEKMGPTEIAELKSVLLAVYVSHAILTLLYFAGLALAAFHPKKRAAHDLLCDSQVVYKLGKPASPKGVGRESSVKLGGRTV
ncbi:MAG: protein kinase, partial [Polyangiales bacterium]